METWATAQRRGVFGLNAKSLTLVGSAWGWHQSWGVKVQHQGGLSPLRHETTETRSARLLQHRTGSVFMRNIHVLVLFSYSVAVSPVVFTLLCEQHICSLDLLSFLESEQKSDVQRDKAHLQIVSKFTSDCNHCCSNHHNPVCCSTS